MSMGIKQKHMAIHELRPTHPASNAPHPFTKVEEVAHEDVVVHLEPTQPNPGRNKADVVRSACPKGKSR